MAGGRSASVVLPVVVDKEGLANGAVLGACAETRR